MNQRKQRLEVHFDPDMIDWIRLEAARLGISLGAVIRAVVRKRMGGLP